MSDSNWIRQLSDLPVRTQWAAITIGSFDGVHRGHASLLKHLRSVVETRGGEVVVVTFHPHPLAVLSKDRAPKLITTFEERANRLFAAGADWVIDLPFPEVRNQDAVEFVEQILVLGLSAKYVLAGPDLHFGRGRSGNSELLAALGPKYGFQVDVAPAVLQGEMRVSSTLIRREVSEQGDMQSARALLGRPHRVTGRVVHGAKRGRQIGFPTANLEPQTELLPAPGIYAASAITVSGESYGAAVSVGHNPTFGTHGLTVEAYLLDFDGDLYGQQLSLDFLARLRGELAFESVEALIEQMDRDVALTRDIVKLET